MRFATVLSDPSQYEVLGPIQSDKLAADVEQSVRTFVKLHSANFVLIVEPGVRDALRGLSESVDLVAEVVHEATNSFWNKRLPHQVLVERQERLDQCAARVDHLRIVAHATFGAFGPAA